MTDTPLSSTAAPTTSSRMTKHLFNVVKTEHLHCDERGLSAGLLVFARCS